MEKLGGIRRRWEEVRGRECRKKEEVAGFQGGDHTVPSLHTKPYQTSVGGGRKK